MKIDFTSKLAIARLGKCIKNAKVSAISDHLLQCDSPITFDDFDILSSDSKKFKLLTMESLLIKHEKPVLNRTIKSFPLDLSEQVLMFTVSKKYDQFSIFNKKRKYIYELSI